MVFLTVILGLDIIECYVKLDYLLSFQQTIQNDLYTPEDYDLFQSFAQKCIEEGDIAQVLSIIVDEKNKVNIG